MKVNSRPTLLLAAAASVTVGAFGVSLVTANPSGAAGGIAAKATTVSLRSEGNLGKVLVGRGGVTVYLFEKDTAHHSACTRTCATFWPPLTGAVHAGKGTSRKLFGSVRRSGKTRQVTYGGHPLYYFSGDTGPGQHNGEGLDAFGAHWYVLNRAGHAVKKADPPTPKPSPSSTASPWA
jgi:predicted lipoprotein with Yx(FWY)xxD motif